MTRNKHQKAPRKENTKPKIRLGAVKAIFLKYIDLSNAHYLKNITTEQFVKSFSDLLQNARGELTPDEYSMLVYVISRDNLYLKQKDN